MLVTPSKNERLLTRLNGSSEWQTKTWKKKVRGIQVPTSKNLHKSIQHEDLLLERDYIHMDEINPQVFQFRGNKNTIANKLLQIFGAQLKLCSDNAGINCSSKLASSIESLKAHEDIIVNELPACCVTWHPWIWQNLTCATAASQQQFTYFTSKSHPCVRKNTKLKHPV